MSRCSKGHFSMYQLHHKFSILSGGARLKRWPGSQPRSSTNRGAVFPPQNPTHPRFGISALESELLVHEVSVGLLAGLPVFSSPPARNLHQISQRTYLHSQREISLLQFGRMYALSRGAVSSLSLSPTPSTLQHENGMPSGAVINTQ